MPLLAAVAAGLAALAGIAAFLLAPGADIADADAVAEPEPEDRVPEGSAPA